MTRWGENYSTYAVDYRQEANIDPEHYDTGIGWNATSFFSKSFVVYREAARQARQARRKGERREQA